MGIFSKKDKQEQEVKRTDRYAYCERVTAGPTTPWHLRLVKADEELILSGLRAVTLCEQDLSGWDLFAPGDEKLLAHIEYYRANPHVEVGRICQKCAEAYETLEK